MPRDWLEYAAGLQSLGAGAKSSIGEYDTGAVCQCDPMRGV